jgi:Dyp-type peroxidase family
MVLRTGATEGPARGVDIVASAAGVAAVIVLVVFVVIAGANTAAYSHVDDAISKLGADGQPYAPWFTVVNVVGAGMIILFAIGVQRRLPVGLLTVVLLMLVAVGAVLIGAFRCSRECKPEELGAHGLVAMFTAVMIVGFLLAAAWAVRRAPVGWFRVATLVSAGLAFVFGIALAVVVARRDRFMGLVERLFWASAYGWVLVASYAIVATSRRRPVVPEFDTGLLQQKILRSSTTWRHAAYVLYEVCDAERAKRWLAAATRERDGVIRPDDAAGVPDGSVTVAFSYRGLRALGVELGDAVDNDPFTEGMGARAELLGDIGASAPGEWQPHWRAEVVHVLAWVEAREPAIVDSLLATLDSLDGSDGLAALDIQRAAQKVNAKDEAVEHLGFRDGISQPWVRLKGDGSDDRARSAGGGTLDAFGQWRPLAVGEFVLGEPDESGASAPVPTPAEIFHHGSYVVVRKLAQDVAGLERFVKTEADRAGVSSDEFAARLVGRQKDGTPLVDPLAPADRQNDFTYRDDVDGFLCPQGAHVRRAHPRDALGFATRLSARHRIIRRGKTYDHDVGAALEWQQGVMFVAVNARIADQFEFIQRFWLNDGDHQRLGSNRDVIAGSSGVTSRVVLQGPRPFVSAPQPLFVRTAGGEYFFAPSMAGLRALIDSAGGPLVQERQDLFGRDGTASPAAAY